MKEVIQLVLTEEESIILQAIVAVGIAVHIKNVTFFERDSIFMEFLMDKWPEASESLANKMTNLVETSMKHLVELKKAIE